MLLWDAAWEAEAGVPGGGSCLLPRPTQPFPPLHSCGWGSTPKQAAGEAQALGPGRAGLQPNSTYRWFARVRG